MSEGEVMGRQQLLFKADSKPVISNLGTEMETTDEKAYLPIKSGFLLRLAGSCSEHLPGLALAMSVFIVLLCACWGANVLVVQ